MSGYRVAPYVSAAFRQKPSREVNTSAAPTFAAKSRAFAGSGEREHSLCDCLMNRRTMLKLSGAGALLLSVCDEVDLVSDAGVEAIGLQVWADIRQTTPVALDAATQRALNDVSAGLLVTVGEARSDWEVLVFG